MTDGPVTWDIHVFPCKNPDIGEPVNHPLGAASKPSEPIDAAAVPKGAAPERVAPR
ncbi:MAG: hypothetical protein ACM3ZE_23970 [Myxococcales bacterium]